MAVVAALGTAVGLVPVLGGTAVAAAEPTAEVVIPAGARDTPRSVDVRSVGTTGYAALEEGEGRYVWTDYASGAQHALPDVAGTAGTDQHSGVVAKLVPAIGETPGRVELTDLASGRMLAITVPTGTVWTRTHTADSIVVAVRSADEKTYSALRRISVVDGKTVERDVTGLPKDTEYAVTYRQDTRGAVIILRSVGGTPAWHLLDYASGALTRLNTASQAGNLVLGTDHLAWRRAGESVVQTLPRSNPAATPVNVPVPSADGLFGLLGGWVLYRDASTPPSGTNRAGNALQAVPVKGGAPRELLPHSAGSLRTGPDGSVLTVGGAGVAEWAVRRVQADKDGVPQLTPVRSVPYVQVPVYAPVLGGGTLSYQRAGGVQYAQDLAMTGEPRPVGERRLRSNLGGYEPVALGNGETAFRLGNGIAQPTEPNSHRPLAMPVDASALVSASGRYAVANGVDGKQYVGDFDNWNDGPLLTRPAQTAAALWGSKLWKPATVAGSVDSYDLRTKQTTPAVNTGSGCVPTQLQAVGRWIYWNCGTTKAGVFDLTAKKNITAPVGGKLGDGFVVTRSADGKLLLTDLLKGGTTADFSTPGVTVGEWTVDAYGGHVAYTDPEQRIHVKPTGIARQAASVIEQQVDGVAVARGGEDPWNGRFLLSRPVASWTVTFTDHEGRTLATRTGTARQGAQIAAEWDGKDDKGKVVVGGRHGWKLSVDQGDGTGASPVAAGALYLSGAKDTPRDYNGDGYGDVMTFTTGGTLHTHQLGTDGTDWPTQSGGWPTTSTFVPYGDLNGDRCNDVLVRDASGALDRYDGACNGAVEPAGPKTRIGTGYQQYDTLTSPGDLTGDGRPDLVARHRTTYDVFLFAGTAEGKLAHPVQIRPNWKAYSHVIGAGDLNGDGHGDLLARASNGDLWRYDGTPNGQFKERVLIFTGWGNGYREIAGVGDVSGDGKADLMVRDTVGGIFRNEGDGKGSFGARRALTTGWQGYKSLF